MTVYGGLIDGALYISENVNWLPPDIEEYLGERWIEEAEDIAAAFGVAGVEVYTL